MDFQFVHSFCLELGPVTEDCPFGPDVITFRIAGKIFALLSVDESPLAINLKAEPEQAIAWREKYPAVSPGYHMNKKHWNTVLLDGSVPKKDFLEMIQHSYQLVVDSLPKKIREDLLH